MGSKARTVVVEVVRAQNLMPKDGQGSASAFVEVDFDSQRKKTKTKVRDLNPAWNERLSFNVSDGTLLEDEVLEVNVYNDKKSSGGNFLGRVRIPGGSIVKEGREAVVPYTLEKRSLFSNVKGEVYLKVFYTGEGQQGGGKKGVKWAMDEDAGEPQFFFQQQRGGLEAEKVVFEQQRQPQQWFQKAEKPQTAAADVRKVASLPNGGAATPTEFGLKETNPKVAAKARRTSLFQNEKSSTYDLVEQLEYLYVKVVKARGLTAKDITGSSDPYVNIKVGNLTAKTRVVDRSLTPEWNQVFAFGEDKFQAPLLELTVKDKDTIRDDFLGYVAFEIAEVPTRVPPDSPLAPQWYKLEGKKNGGNHGELMVSVWRGTQADEAFPEAWQSDSGGHTHARSKVYLSPKLWYLRVNVIEAQDLVFPGDKNRLPDLTVKAQLGFQTARTRPAGNRANGGSSPFWNEDLMFVAAEPFEDQLVLSVEDRVGPNKDEIVGRMAIPLANVDRRVDHRQVTSRWFTLEKHLLPEKQNNQGQPNTPAKPKDSSKFTSRIHLRVCLDGGYHVLDESTLYSSDMRPTAKQIWKPPIGVLELGILRASGLMPVKTKEGRGSTDAYVVAKYGQKWVRSRTIVDSLAPCWQEQYTWEVYDPCTVLTVGVFDNGHLVLGNATSDKGKDTRLGKVRIRLSTLEADRVYTHSYPLLQFQAGGLKKMGELELAVRFSSASLLNMLLCYSQPLLPKMHYIRPLGVAQLEALRNAAIRMVAVRLQRAEPPFRQEVVQYMLDVDSNLWSMRKSKANWFRILGVLSGIIAVGRWSTDICEWKNPVTTVLVHLLFIVLIWYPELILPTLFLYMFLIGLWQFRYRSRNPPHMDPRLSHADAAHPDELDEEFDSFPTSKSQEIVRARYDRLRAVAGRIQTVLGDIATQGERLHALLSWRDPRATSMFICFCLLAAILLYVTPFRVVAILYGLYVLRHPRFRSKMPGVHMNFFRRLPALSDRML